MKKTTIAIIPESREELGKLKRYLEFQKRRFVDLDEVISYLLELVPDDVKTNKFYYSNERVYDN